MIAVYKALHHSSYRRLHKFAPVPTIVVPWPDSINSHQRCPLSLLWREFQLSNPGSPQLDPQHSLHGTKHLLVRRRSAPLEVLDDCDSGVAFCGKILLRHLGLDFIPTLHDSLPDFQADCLGFHNLVGTVYFSQVLSFYRRSL